MFWVCFGNCGFSIFVENQNDMESYHKLTYDLIPGQTDREKYNSMLLIIELLNDLSFPKRGEEKSLIDLIEKALEICDHYIETK